MQSGIQACNAQLQLAAKHNELRANSSGSDTRQCGFVFFRMYSMSPRLRRTILWGGTGWGVLMLMIGLVASFSIGANDTIVSVFGFFLIFVLPIFASIAARWIPMISGITLLMSVVVLLIGFYSKGGLTDVLRVLSRVYLWPHFFFGISFILFSKELKKERIKLTT